MSHPRQPEDRDRVDVELVKALGHPLRLRMLEIFLERGETTPSDVARDLGRPVSTVSRHVRLLRDLGFLRLARTEQRRGAVAHFYRATRLALVEESEWDRLPVVLRRGLVGQTFRRLFQEAAHFGGAGGFDASSARLQRLPLSLDGRGWRELASAIDALLDEAQAVQARSDVRRESGSPDASAGSSVLGVMHFATPSKDFDATLPVSSARSTRE